LTARETAAIRHFSTAWTLFETPEDGPFFAAAHA
jgi:hypothetical protein